MARVSDQTIIDVWTRQEGVCAICGEPLSESAWENHHMQRVADGGEDSPENIVLLCDRDEHEYVHGGNFRAELQTTKEAYPYYFGKSGVDQHEPSEEDTMKVEDNEPGLEDVDPDAEENIEEGGNG